MGLTRKQRILLGVAGLGLAAVVVDRAILLPASASAAGTGPMVVDASDPAVAEVEQAGEPASFSTAAISAILDRTADDLGYDRTDLDLGTLEPLPTDTAPLLADAPGPSAVPNAGVSSLRLTSVMPSGERRVAVINGTPVMVGGVVPGTGWRLVAVGPAHADLTDGATTHRIRLPRP